MDIERTMEFILQQQAKAEARSERYEARLAQAEARAEARAAQAEAKAERQMAAIRKLIQTGMRMIVKNETLIKEVAAAQKATESELRTLAAAQKVTETKLQGFIDFLRRGGNGSHRKN
jgi:membrane protein involved in colicin uptake